MDVLLNNQKYSLNETTTCAQLVALLGYQDKRIALEINSEIVRKSSYDERVLKSNDKIEIVVAVGGG